MTIIIRMLVAAVYVCKQIYLSYAEHESDSLVILGNTYYLLNPQQLF
jgi:hypothetical protein